MIITDTARNGKMGTLWVLFLHVALPLTVGGCIYLLFRSRSLLMFEWWETLHLMPFISNMRDAVGTWGSTWPSWALYSLPDGTWLYAYIVFYRWIWMNHSQRWMWFWLSLGLMGSVGLELAQGCQWVSGTFDWVDMLFYGLAIGGAFKANLPVSDPIPVATGPVDR